MSWSIQCVGQAEKVIEALEAKSEIISKDPNDSCRREYDEAKPHLIALVKQNYADQSVGYTKPLIQLEASGSASRQRRADDTDFKLVQSSVQVSIKSLWNYVG